MSYWCWQTTETTPTLLYQLSLQTNDWTHFHLHIMCNTQPLSHHTTHYWTYWTLEYTYSSSTHLIRHSGVQLELVNGQSDNIHMAFPSCTVDHSESIVVRTVEQRLQFGGQVTDSVDVATLCR